MPKSNFEILNHTADIGIRAKGKDKAEMISSAVMGLYSVCGINVKNIIESKYSIILKTEGTDFVNTLINFLNEIIYTLFVEKRIFRRFEFMKIEDKIICAMAFGERLKGIHKIEREIKSVTYHKFKIGNNFIDFYIDI